VESLGRYQLLLAGDSQECKVSSPCESESGHKIPLGESDAVEPPPGIDGLFVVQCDDCGKEYSYGPDEILRLQLELPASFTPHPLFGVQGWPTKGHHPRSGALVRIRLGWTELLPIRPAWRRRMDCHSLLCAVLQSPCRLRWCVSCIVRRNNRRSCVAHSSTETVSKCSRAPPNTRLQL
jgi:hypothetical protein